MCQYFANKSKFLAENAQISVINEADAIAVKRLVEKEIREINFTTN